MHINARIRPCRYGQIPCVIEQLVVHQELHRFIAKWRQLVDRHVRSSPKFLWYFQQHRFHLSWPPEPGPIDSGCVHITPRVGVHIRLSRGWCFDLLSTPRIRETDVKGVHRRHISTNEALLHPFTPFQHSSFRVTSGTNTGAIAGDVTPSSVLLIGGY